MINQHYQSSIARRKVSSQTEKRELFKKEKARAKKKKSRNALELSIASDKESLESGDDESESSARSLTRSTSLHNALRSSPRASRNTASSGVSRNSSCSQDETSDCDSVSISGSSSSFEGSSCSDEPADSTEATYSNATARLKATSSSTREKVIHKSNGGALSGWVLALLALCGALLAFFSVRF